MEFIYFNENGLKNALQTLMKQTIFTWIKTEDKRYNYELKEEVVFDDFILLFEVKEDTYLKRIWGYSFTPRKIVIREKRGSKITITELQMKEVKNVKEFLDWLRRTGADELVGRLNDKEQEVSGNEK